MQMRVKPWGKDQGDHVLIEVADFAPGTHEPLNEAEAAKVAHLMPVSPAPPADTGAGSKPRQQQPTKQPA